MPDGETDHPSSAAAPRGSVLAMLDKMSAQELSGLIEAAEAMGVSPGEVFKTLMAAVDGKPVCVLVPSDREVSLKKLAAAFAGKSAAMMRPADAERLTGYHVGGISPLGQKRVVPTLVDAAALGHPEIFVNGGQRGLQLRVKPDDLVRVLQARTEAVT